MTQHPTSMSPISALAVEERLGNTIWEKLEWFVKFAQKDLNQATEGEKLSIQEELATLELFTVINDVRASSTSVPLPEWSTVKNTQKVIYGWLTDWVDHSQVLIGPFTLELEIKRVSRTEDLLKAYSPKSQTLIPGQEPFGQVARFNFKDKNQAVLYRFTELIKEHGTVVTRCPHCLRIFLKLRKNARYCGRSCHSVAGMRAKRAKERELTKGKQAPKPESKPRVKFSRKKRKEKPHGQKKRKR